MNFLPLMLEQRAVVAAITLLLGLFVFSGLSFLLFHLRITRLPAAGVVDYLGYMVTDVMGSGVPGSTLSVPRPSSKYANRLARFIEPHVVGKRREKFVIVVPIQSAIDEWVERLRASSFGFLIGSTYTGIALVCTFGLIAWVLFTDVSQAIQQNTANSGALANAVRTMGAKFVISSTGLLLAILHMFVQWWQTHGLRTALDRLEGELAPCFIDLRRAKLEIMEESLSCAREVRPSIEQHERHSVERLDRLRDIEVSVKDLGGEVTASLDGIMREAIAEQVRSLLTDMRAFAEQIAGDVQKSVQGNLGELSGQLVTALSRIQTALESQPQSEVEKLLRCVQDAVTGGFSSETKNMSKLLSEFQNVFPTLAHQLQGVSENLQAVLSGLAAQQQAHNALMEGMAQATADNVQRLGSELAREGSGAMERVLHATNERIDGMVQALHEAAQHTAGRASGMRTDFELTAARVCEITPPWRSCTGLSTVMVCCTPTSGSRRRGSLVSSDMLEHLRSSMQRCARRACSRERGSSPALYFPNGAAWDTGAGRPCGMK